jgi:predicted polyphosphate/ATP-dependent NAD kinase
MNVDRSPKTIGGPTLMHILKLGLIVNPIAGMGGRVGLKGTDGEETLAKARRLGATPVSPTRSIETLREIATIADQIELVTCPGDMGETEALSCGFDPNMVECTTNGETSATDTRNAALAMMNSQVDLLLFAGGDGTARDICGSIGQNIPALGIPTGVKIYSATFAVNPKRAGELAVKFLQGEVPLREAEVMDIDEQAYRNGRLSAELYGYLKIPYEEELVQSTKSASFATSDETASQDMIAEYVVEKMTDDCYYVLCPGTTVKAVSDKLGIAKTLLGVDLVHKRSLLGSDLNEQQLLRLIDQKKAKIIVSPVGKQGFIFGRGNPQISPAVIRKVGKQNVLIIATRNKLSSIGFGRPLLVDTGDDETDGMLSGYARIIIGYKEEAVIKIA